MVSVLLQKVMPYTDSIISFMLSRHMPALFSIPPLLPLQARLPCMLIIRGVPGSGKSTLAQNYIKSIPDVVHCEADHYFINKQGQYCYDGRKIKNAHAFCQQNNKKCLKPR